MFRNTEHKMRQEIPFFCSSITQMLLFHMWTSGAKRTREKIKKLLNIHHEFHTQTNKSTEFNSSKLQ